VEYKRTTDVVKRREITLVGREAQERHKLGLVPTVLNRTELECAGVHFHDLVILGRILLRNALEHLNEALEQDLFDLLEELGRLQSLTGDIEWKIIS
jgi:hypothetical protein